MHRIHLHQQIQEECRWSRLEGQVLVMEVMVVECKNCELDYNPLSKGLDHHLQYQLHRLILNNNYNLNHLHYPFQPLKLLYQL